MIQSQKKASGKRAAQTAANKKNLTTALTYFVNKKKYTGITVRSLCTRAHLSTSSFYHLYPSLEIFVFPFLIDQFHEYIYKHEEQLQKLQGIDRLIAGYEMIVLFAEEKGVDYISFFQNTYSKALFICNYRDVGTESADDITARLTADFDQAIQLGQLSHRYEKKVIFTYINIILSANLSNWCYCSGKFDIGAMTIMCLNDFFKYELTEANYSHLKKIAGMDKDVLKTT